MNNLLGTGLILISAAAFGAIAIFAKFAYSSGIPVHCLLFYRFSIAAMVMLPIALFQKRRFPKGKDLFILIAMGTMGYAGQSYCYFSALTLIPPQLVAILLYLYPVMVAVLSIFFLDETLTKNKLFALTIAISGTLLVIGVETSTNIKGILLGIGAAVIYAFYNIVGARVMKRNDTFTSCLVIISSAGFFYFLYNVKSGFFFPPSGIDWVYIIAIAVISTVVAISTYFKGMTLCGAVNASMLSTFEPVTTMVLASLFLGEHITWLQMSGTALILTSAVIISTRSKSE